MRPINNVIIQITDLQSPNHLIESHMELGMPMVGFHYIVDKDASITIGRNINTIGNHCVSHNSNSIGIAVIGNEISTVQYSALNSLIEDIKMKVPDIRNVFMVEGGELKQYK